MESYHHTSVNHNRFYAGIGSRETPSDIQEIMLEIGMILAQKGYVLRSGHAPGADLAFEMGCDSVAGVKRIYVPRKGDHGIYVENPPSTQILATPAAHEIAAKFHPAWDKCSAYARGMHARNVHIMFGKDLIHPVKFVICWTPNGLITGGTGLALRIAEHHEIPVYNMGKTNTATQACLNASGDNFSRSVKIALAANLNVY